MKRFFPKFMPALFCALWLLPAAPAQGRTVDETVAAIENHYRTIDTISARVVQKNHLKSIDRTQTFDASLNIKKPGRLRLDYSNGQVIVINGKEALFYSQKNEQLIRKDFSDFEQSNIPVAFLLGAGNLRKDFEVRRGNEPLQLELVPRKQGAAMSRILIASDAVGRITAMTIFDKSGNMTEIVFSEAVEGGPIEDALFRFKPPKGTEIIEQ